MTDHTEADLTRRDALIAQGVCPSCGGELHPVAFISELCGCPECRRTWYIPINMEANK